jgi:hypothetical protein
MCFLARSSPECSQRALRAATGIPTTNFSNKKCPEPATIYEKDEDMSTKHIQTLRGKGRLLLTAGAVPVDYEIDVFQGFDHDVPTLKSAKGRMWGLSVQDALSAMTAMSAFTPELADEKKARVLVIDMNGTVQVTGSIE